MAKSKDPAITLKDFRPQVQNANKHTQRGLGMLDQALTEDGYVAPMTATADGEIIDGSARLERAAERFANVEPIIVEHDGTRPIIMRRTDIANARTPIAKRIALRANRIAELNLDWDDDVLNAAFEEIPELREWWNDAATIADEPSDVDAEPQLNRADELQVDWKVERGQVWLLDGHRVMCGDSSSKTDVARLMNGEHATLFATDPPYGIDYVATKAGIPRTGYETLAQDYSDITADSLRNEELQAFLTAIFTAWLPVLKNAGWYLWHAGLEQGFYVAAAATSLGVLLHRQLIWVKPGFNLTRSGMYHWAHENAYFGWVKGQQPPWYGEKNQRSVWEIDRIREKSAHPTCKPPELWHAPMQNHTKPGEICAEPFAGSGSQIIAAEQLGRRCYAMEVEPKYVAVSLQRFVDATNKTPTRID